MKYKLSEMTPGEPYAVLFWQGAWHVVKVDAISATAQDLRVRWLATGFGSFEIAEHVRENYARRADLATERESAGLCACGLPYEAHDANYHSQPASQPAWTGDEEEYPEDSGNPEMDI